MTFAYSKPFPGLKYTASLDWSKQLFKPMNMDFAFEALRKLAILGYGRFKFEIFGDKWLQETVEEEEEWKKQAPIRQQLSRKDSTASA